MNKFLLIATLFAGASAFAPQPAFRASTQLYQDKPDWDAAAELGWSMGGEDYTRDVQPQEHEDSRKTIHQGESFEEYMKSRAQGN